LLLATLIGWVAHSAAVFVIALVALLSLDLIAGKVRPKGR
jgi:hypothetical protein